MLLTIAPGAGVGVGVGVGVAVGVGVGDGDGFFWTSTVSDATIVAAARTVITFRALVRALITWLPLLSAGTLRSIENVPVAVVRPSAAAFTSLSQRSWIQVLAGKA